MDQSVRKWLTGPDEYKCTLSEETQKIAKEEIREDDFTRKQALDSMRNWIMQNPRIIDCRLDAQYLLRFLRHKKFSVQQAQQSLERYLVLRKTYSPGFCQFDITRPDMEELVDLGIVVPCPKRDKHGRIVVVLRLGMFDVSKYTMEDLLRVVGMSFEPLMEDEENQVRGFTYYATAKDIGFQFLSIISPRDVNRFMKHGEKTLPMRHRTAYVIDVPPIYKKFLDIGMSWLPEKFQRRVNLFSNAEEVTAAGVFEPDLLPKEYGGTMPLAEMIRIFKEKLKQSRELLLSHDKMFIREELFSEKERTMSASVFKIGQCSALGSEDHFKGVAGNFRKLEID